MIHGDAGSPISEDLLNDHSMMSHGFSRLHNQRASQRLPSKPQIQLLSPLIQSVGTDGSPGLRNVCSQLEQTFTSGLCAWTASVYFVTYSMKLSRWKFIHAVQFASFSETGGSAIPVRFLNSAVHFSQ